MASPELVVLAQAVSRLCGWAYFLAWSLSFYPQIILNWQRKSTQGITVDYPLMNVLGFCAYSITTSAFLFSPTIRTQYAERHPVSPTPVVRLNDFAFAVHALVMCIIVYSQFWARLWGFEAGAKQRASRVVLGIFWGCIFGVAIIVLLVLKGGEQSSRFAWIDVIYSIGYVKLVVTVVKYIPQAWFNYQRKSTAGWSINQILCDISGGFLSISQLLIDCSLQDDWSGILGNPVKLGLGNVSIFFDAIFILQHYILYKKQDQASVRAEEAPWQDYEPLE